MTFARKISGTIINTAIIAATRNMVGIGTSVLSPYSLSMVPSSYLFENFDIVRLPIFGPIIMGRVTVKRSLMPWNWPTLSSGV